MSRGMFDSLDSSLLLSAHSWISGVHVVYQCPSTDQTAWIINCSLSTCTLFYWTSNRGIGCDWSCTVRVSVYLDPWMDTCWPLNSNYNVPRLPCGITETLTAVEAVYRLITWRWQIVEFCSASRHAICSAAAQLTELLTLSLISSGHQQRRSCEAQ